MLWFCLGTAAELIKVFPVLERCEQRGVPWFVVSTGQSGRTFWEQWNDFRLPRARAAAVVSTSADLEAPSSAARWLGRALLRRGAGLRRFLAQASGVTPTPRDRFVVHGDTLSSALGSHWARQLGVPLAHLEAGLSSGHLLEPFPEELARRFVSRRADLLFPPDAVAASNLERWHVPGKVRVTGGNTLMDAVSLVLARTDAAAERPSGPYVVANIHRFENLVSRARLSRVVDILAAAAARFPVYMVQHRQTEETLRREPALRSRLERAGVRLMGRMPFSRFIQWIAGADCVVTDGGSNQEECSYLGVPCLILRHATERREGLGESCVLNGLDLAGAISFLDAPARHRRPPVAPAERPSDIVLREITGD